MPQIHPSAIVAEGAELGTSVEVGAYSVLGPNIQIGAGTRIMSHVYIDGYTRIGERCTLFPFASLGTQTQDLKFKGGKPGVTIEDDTTIREYVTVNAATNDGDLTRVGSHCHIMAYAHIAHDCIVGNHVIMANCATLAGHVTIEDGAIIGGLCGIHQFVRVGQMCIIGGCSKVTQDIPPFMMADGHPLEVRGLNRIGLKRKGVDGKTQKALKESFKWIYRKGLNRTDAVARIESEVEGFSEVQHLVEFLKSSERGIS